MVSLCFIWNHDTCTTCTVKILILVMAQFSMILYVPLVIKLTSPTNYETQCSFIVN